MTQSTQVFRAFLPYASEVELNTSQGWQTLAKAHPHGLFEWQGSDSVTSPCKLRIKQHEQTIETFDVYSFAPMLTSDELHLFGEGNLKQAYKTMGAQLCQHQGIARMNDSQALILARLQVAAGTAEDKARVAAWDRLFAMLNVLDSKTSALLRFNAIVVAALAYLVVVAGVDPFAQSKPIIKTIGLAVGHVSLLLSVASCGCAFPVIGIAHGFFTRQGGHSDGIFASLNCGLGSGDDRDFLELSFAGGDKIFVPVEQIGRVTAAGAAATTASVSSPGASRATSPATIAITAAPVAGATSGEIAKVSGIDQIATRPNDAMTRPSVADCAASATATSSATVSHGPRS